MKAKMVVLVVVLLLVAMVPALVMAGSQAKPEKMGRVTIDIRQPIGPQLDAQLGVSSRGPRSIGAVALAPRASQGIQPNSVYGLLNDGFEPPWAEGLNWLFFEAGGSTVGWDATTIESKRGQGSLYSAAFNNDEYINPFYEDDMFSGAFYPMDLQGARRVQVRFQFKNDSELNWDYFYWCVSSDGFTFYCGSHTGSTNDKWRLVTMDSRTDPALASMLDQPFVYFGYIFESDPFCCVDTGAFVDVLRIRAWGPSPIN